MAVINGTAAAETLPGTAGNDTITGAAGNDKALMGGGNDLFVWNDGDGNDTVEGGAGTDTLDFTGSAAAESLQIVANGPRAQLFRNVGIVTLDINDVERVELQALGGADTIYVDHLTGTDLKQVVLDLSSGVAGAGDGATDTVFVNGSKVGNILTLASIGGDMTIMGLAAQIRVTGGETADSFYISGQDGNDKISAALLSAGLPQLALYGGTGNDVLIGSARNDVLEGGEGNDTASGGGSNDLAVLGAGNDLFLWNAGDGDDFVDGGLGTDTLRATGSALDEIFHLLPFGGNAQVTRDLDNVDVRSDDVERLELRTLGGEDTVLVSDFAGTDVTSILVDLAAVAGGAAADKNADTVIIEGRPAADNLKIASVGTKIVTTGLSAPITVDHASKIDVLSVRGGSGDDFIDASKLAAGKVSLQLDGYKGADTLVGSIGNDVVTGGFGDDAALLGSGNDLFVWNSPDGNDTVDGQAGTDAFQASGDAAAEAFAMSANGAKASLTRDVGGVAIDLDNVERIQLQAFGGIDVITVNNLAGTDVKLVAVDLTGGLGGDAAPDAVYQNAALGNDKIAVGLAGSLVAVTGLAAQLTISGAELGNDTLTINALAGNDSVDLAKLPAGAMSVFVYGGAGNDTVLGGAADDLVYGGDDNDVLNGGGGGDVLLGENGNDTVTGGAGADFATLGSGDDLFIWNPGDGGDLVEGDADADTVRVNGGNADDSVFIQPVGGRTEIQANGESLDINDVERIEVRTLGGADTVIVTDLTGTDVATVAIDLAATAGGRAADAKSDMVIISTAPAGSTVISSLGGKVTAATEYAKITVDHAGRNDSLVAYGSSGGDAIDSTALAAGVVALQVYAVGGNDVIHAGAGNDTVNGGDGNDTAFLGGGNDSFLWYTGDDNDLIEGQAGFDRLEFNGSNGGEIVELVGSGGRVHLSRNIDSVFLDIDDVERIELLAGAGADLVSLNVLTGTDLKQVAIDLGSVGAVDGSADTVLIAGTDGKDVITITQLGGAVSIAGLGAQVTVSHADAFDIIAINGLAGDDSITAATLKAGAVVLEILGDLGKDKIAGSLGNDHLHGGADNDKLLGGGGDDWLEGENGDDAMDGGLGSDLLLGGPGNDVLTGSAGNDALFGGEGDDTITGGAGNDTIFYTGQGDGHDLVIGFDGNPVGGQDVLDLDRLFDSLDVATKDRAGRIAILDHGAAVDVLVDLDGSPFTAALLVATLKTSDPITVGQDVLPGLLTS